MGYTQDIAIATGASFVAEELGITLDSVTLDMLGTADRIVCAKEMTTIVIDGKHQQDIEARISQLLREADAADTDTELKDKKLRYEDALNSVQSARELGVVPGG